MGFTVYRNSNSFKGKSITNFSISISLFSLLGFYSADRLICQLIKDVLTSLEYKSTTLCDCFIQLVKLAIIIKSSSMLTNTEFRSFCLEKFNLRWSQFDFKLYMLGFFSSSIQRQRIKNQNFLTNMSL